MNKSIIVLLLGGFLFSCKSSSDQEPIPEPTTPAIMYTNPVVSTSLPDPTVIRAKDGYFYLYATEDIRNVPIFQSKDLISWKQVGTAFTDQTRPHFVENGGIWAPEIRYINNQYVLYYSMSTWGGVEECGIGVATSSSPKGPFTDKGPIFQSYQIGVTNSIDQFYMEDEGKKYLFWGSFNGIYAIELSDDGLSLKEGAEKVKVAGNAYEGTNIHKKGDYYYLIASTGSCCEGANSTYTTVVGRSKNLLGPYVNKEGKAMLDNQHEIVVKGNEHFVGTGHNAIIVSDKNGNDWMLYHAYEKKNADNGRVLLLDCLLWKNGWPSTASQVASIKAKAPIFD